MAPLFVSNSVHSTNSFPSKATSSAEGLLALLSEDDITLRSAALKRLLNVVDSLWHEVAEFLPDLEALSEDDSLDLCTRQTAAAVASRVFFHLEEPYQALRLALEGGTQNFDVVNNRTSAYVECLVSAAIDAYVKKQQFENKDTEVIDIDDKLEEELAAIDSKKLQQVVQLMFERCYDDDQYTHALGVALEARQEDKVEEILLRCPPSLNNQICPTLLYALKAAIEMVSSKSFRGKVITIVSDKLEQISVLDNMHVASTLTLCHQLLDLPSKVAETLTILLDSTLDHALIAYQICFDIVDTGDQKFVAQVSKSLPQKPDLENAPSVNTSSTPRSDEIWDRFAQVKRVLVEGFSSELSLSFLHKHSDSDRRIMENLKKSLEERGGSRNSALHHCAIVAHAYLNAGTTNDSFLRDHLEWMKKASNWYVLKLITRTCFYSKHAP